MRLVVNIGRVASVIALCSVSSATLPFTDAAAPPAAAISPLRCTAFSPYSEGYDPGTGPHPGPAVIDAALDHAAALGFNCIETYGVLNGLDYTFEGARRRGLKVIAIIWLDLAADVNAASIAKGIQVAAAYRDTIIQISCGSEVRLRNHAAADAIITDCLAKLRAAGIRQPLTAIDTWWGWCNEQWPCQAWPIAAEVDWIGINVFPWWENKFSGLFPCTTASQAADFHVARVKDIMLRYPGKPVVLTEFGWPAGPDGYSETNVNTGQRCGIANNENQSLVKQTTTSQLEHQGFQGVFFELEREPWKSREGAVGPFWGLPLVPTAPTGLRIIR